MNSGPETDSENFLVDLMIQARCKLVRFDRLQGLAFEQVLTEPGSSADPDARILGALGASGNLIDKLERYAAAARRAYYQARARARKFQGPHPAHGDQSHQQLHQGVHLRAHPHRHQANETKRSQFARNQPRPPPLRIPGRRLKFAGFASE